MPMPRHLLFSATAWLVLTTGSSQARPPDTWPTQPVRVVVPAAAGTAPDLMARILADRLSRTWRQPVIVENKPGAGGVIGFAAVKHARRDNHALVFSPASALTTASYIFRPRHVDIARDFTAVSLVGVSPMVLAVAAGSGMETVQDVVAAARKSPDGLVVATTTAYSVPHLAADLLAKAVGVPLRAVPFATSGQSMSAVVNGDAQLVIDGIPPLDAMAKAGRLKAIAAFSDRRLPDRQQLPTLVESGYASMVVNGWFGVVAPTGTAPAVLAQVHQDLASALAEPDIAQRFASLGVYVRPMTIPQFAMFWQQERQRWEKALRDMGARPLQ